MSNILKGNLILFVGLSFSIGAQAGISLKAESIYISPKAKAVDFAQVNAVIKGKGTALPMDQLKKDFHSLISESKESNRDNIEFEDSSEGISAELEKTDIFNKVKVEKNL